MSLLTKSFTLAYQSFCCLYVDNLTTRRPFSGSARASVRDNYFHSRAKIRSVALSEFCGRLGKEYPPSVTLPPFCAEANEGIGAEGYFMSLAAISAARQPQQIVEFGTFLGVSALVFTLNAPNARILTIDLPDEAGEQSYLDETDQRHVKVSRYKVGKAYKGTPQAARIRELKCDSRQLRLNEQVEAAELVFVDGGHDLGCITADTANAFSVARPRTVILWDDYFWMYPDVVHFLDQLAETRELVAIVGTNLVGHICP